MLMDLLLSDIVVGERHRRVLGNIPALAASIQDVGLLHPVVVDETHRLIAGARRMAAFEHLGRETVPAYVVRTFAEAEQYLRAERDENTCREALLPTEIDTLRRALLEIEKPAAQARKQSSNAERGKFPTSAKGRARSKVAQVVGVSDRTLEKIASVVEAAQVNPEAYKPVVQEMDRTGNVDAAYRVIRRDERRQAWAQNYRATVPLDTMRPIFGVVYADPPWEYEHCESENRAIENQYPTMPLADIQALPVETVCMSDAVLFLWATPPKVEEALTVLRAWGFRYRTCMVWVKDKIGMGYYCRQRHELLLIGTRGEPVTPNPPDRPDSVLEAPRGSHSAKPAQFYDHIEAMYPGIPKIELFLRGTPRPGWDGWGNQLTP